MCARNGASGTAQRHQAIALLRGATFVSWLKADNLRRAAAFCTFRRLAALRRPVLAGSPPLRCAGPLPSPRLYTQRRIGFDRRSGRRLNGLCATAQCQSALDREPRIGVQKVPPSFCVLNDQRSRRRSWSGLHNQHRNLGPYNHGSQCGPSALGGSIGCRSPRKRQPLDSGVGCVVGFNIPFVFAYLVCNPLLPTPLEFSALRRSFQPAMTSDSAAQNNRLELHLTAPFSTGVALRSLRNAFERHW